MLQFKLARCVVASCDILNSRFRLVPPECPDASDEAAVAVDDDEAVLDFPEVLVALANP